ncbi:MAG: preprotein translocase subunit SecE, partial [Patescibacteria group bacterium]
LSSLPFTCQLRFVKIFPLKPKHISGGFKLFMATSPATFIRETRDELKKVRWPTRADIIRLTSVVIIVSLIVGVFLGTLDYLLTKLTELLIR